MIRNHSRRKEGSVSLTKRNKRNSRNCLDSTSNNVNSIEPFNDPRNSYNTRSPYSIRKLKPNKIKYTFSNEFLKSLYSAHNLILEKNVRRPKKYTGSTAVVSHSKERKGNLLFLSKSPMSLKKSIPNRSIHKREHDTSKGILKALDRKVHKNIFIQNVFLNNAKRTLINKA